MEPKAVLKGYVATLRLMFISPLKLLRAVCSGSVYVLGTKAPFPLGSGCSSGVEHLSVKYKAPDSTSYASNHAVDL